MTCGKSNECLVRKDEMILAYCSAQGKPAAPRAGAEAAGASGSKLLI
jgi:hypothetical protein